MNLDKKTIKNIVITIFIVALIWAGFQNLGTVFVYAVTTFRIIFPFILGGAIAFLLNIPMDFFERTIFGNKYTKDKKILSKMARPCSLVLSIAAIAAVITGVFTVVVPQLADTVRELGITVYKFLPKAESWILNIINNDYFRSKVREFFNEFDWTALTNYLGSFFRSGGDMLSSTLGVVSNIFSAFISRLV